MVWFARLAALLFSSSSLGVSAADDAQSSRSDELQNALQNVLDSVALLHKGVPIQLGWKSATTEFSLAAGTVRVPGQAPRPTTVEDTFLFGSGVKPFTATAVMALRDRGLLSLDDPLEKHIDGWLSKLKPGATMRSLFGDEAAKITVGHTLRMQSGVQDFDFPPFDQFLLWDNQTYKVHSPFEFVEYASQQVPKLQCEPGTCVIYSSNNFVLAGFILLAHANVTEWWDLDLPALLPPGTQEALGGGFFFQKEMLDTKLTVPGHSSGGWAQTPPTTIWNQSSTILGWTCGNLVGTAQDMAGFLWALLGPEAKVLPRSTVQEMAQFKPISEGWAANEISYGTGLMIESVTGASPPDLSEWGSYIGHGGDTFGFLSEQGIVTGLNASIAITAATDADGIIITREALCRTIQTAARIVAGVHVSFPCLPRQKREEFRSAQRGAAGENTIVI